MPSSSGENVRALALLKTMKSTGVRPDSYSYNAVIAACEGSGEWQQVR